MTSYLAFAVSASIQDQSMRGGRFPSILNWRQALGQPPLNSPEPGPERCGKTQIAAVTCNSNQMVTAMVSYSQSAHWGLCMGKQERLKDNAGVESVAAPISVDVAPRMALARIEQPRIEAPQDCAIAPAQITSPPTLVPTSMEALLITRQLQAERVERVVGPARSRRRRLRSRLPLRAAP